MAISAEQLAKSLNAAQHLMSSEGQQKINEARNNFAATGYDTTQYEYDYNSIVGGQYVQENTQRPVSGNMNPSNSKLPQAIVESMMNHQIDTSCLDPNGMTNVMKLVEQNTPQIKKQVIKEDKVLPTSTTGIDYGLIKTIVEECIDRKLRELNENTLKGIKLKEGKIMLVDNGGNVFNATLEYKGKQKK
jgi:hypothetical protein